jgi:hypothetical protein
MNKPLTDILNELTNRIEWAVNPAEPGAVPIDRDKEEAAKIHAIAKLNEYIEGIIGADTDGCPEHGTPNAFCSSGDCLVGTAVNGQLAAQRKRAGINPTEGSVS